MYPWKVVLCVWPSCIWVVGCWYSSCQPKLWQNNIILIIYAFSFDVDWLDLPPSKWYHVWIWSANEISVAGMALLLINMKMPPFAPFRTVYQAPKLKKIQQHCCHFTAFSSYHKLARKFQHWNWVNIPHVLLVYADVFVNETSRTPWSFEMRLMHIDSTTAGLFHLFCIGETTICV